MRIGGWFCKWEAAECAKAAEIYKQAVAAGGSRLDCVKAVSVAIGRSINGVSNRLTYYGPSFNELRDDGKKRRSRKFINPSAPHRKIESSQWCEPPPDVVADRDYRRELEHDSLTAAMMGDPKPGYSALDRAS